MAQFRILPLTDPEMPPARTDWPAGPSVPTPFGFRALLLLDEAGRVVPAAWLLDRTADYCDEAV